MATPPCSPFSKRLTTRLSFCTAAALVAVNAVQLYGDRELLSWWHLAVVPLALLTADLLSGIVHWLADSFGSEATPLIGTRFILPFRQHHDSSDDIAGREFFDLNGDVALGVIPLLLLAASAGSRGSNIASLLHLFVFAVAVTLMPTNQIHQWAHRENVTRFVSFLQQAGLILSPVSHLLHHTPPHARSYCITAGWCDPLLDALVGDGSGKTIRNHK